MGKQTTESLKTEYDELLFAAQRSVRYHRHQQRFLDRIPHLSSLLSALGGAATSMTLVAELPAGSEPHGSMHTSQSTKSRGARWRDLLPGARAL